MEPTRVETSTFISMLSLDLTGALYLLDKFALIFIKKYLYKAD
jgi:hypothetical protein